jgi:hypothetical protein
MSRREWSTDRAECEVVVEVEVDLFELAGSCFSWNCRDPFYECADQFSESRGWFDSSPFGTSTSLHLYHHLFASVDLLSTFLGLGERERLRDETPVIVIERCQCEATHSLTAM